MSDTPDTTPAAMPSDPSTPDVPATDSTPLDGATSAPPADGSTSEGAPADGSTFPDRLAVDPSSPHHVAAVFELPIGIRFNGRERHDVEEYCVSEGWIKVAAGKTKDRRGRPLLMTLRGRVEPFRP